MTLVARWIFLCTWQLLLHASVNEFNGSIYNFYQSKNHNAWPIFHTGPLTEMHQWMADGALADGAHKIEPSFKASLELSLSSDDGLCSQQLKTETESSHNLGEEGSPDISNSSLFHCLPDITA